MKLFQLKHFNGNILWIFLLDFSIEFPKILLPKTYFNIFHKMKEEDIKMYKQRDGKRSNKNDNLK